MLPRGVVQGKADPKHQKFPERLRRARKAASMNGVALSLSVGLSRNTCSQLEARDRIPRVDTVEKLATALRVSPCWLAYGIEQPCEAGDGSLSAGLPARLAHLRQEKGLSRRELGRLSDTSDNFVQMTETGGSVPSIAKVETLAKALQVSACWLAYGVGERDLPPRRRSRTAAQSPAPA